MDLEVWIPLLPPGINTQYGVGRHGRIYKANEHKKWQKDAALYIGSAAGLAGWQDDCEQYDIRIVTFNSRMDADAPVKLVTDTVAEKLGFNDSKIRYATVGKEEGKETGTLIVLTGVEE